MQQSAGKNSNTFGSFIELKEARLKNADVDLRIKPAKWGNTEKCIFVHGKQTRHVDISNIVANKMEMESLNQVIAKIC